MAPEITSLRVNCPDLRHRRRSGQELVEQPRRGGGREVDRSPVVEVEHPDPLPTTGGGGDQVGEAGAPLEEGGAEVPADHRGRVRAPRAAGRGCPSGPRGDRRTGRGPAPRQRSWASPAPAARATTATRTEPPGDGVRRDEREQRDRPGRDHGAGPAPAPGPYVVPDQLAVDGARRPSTSAATRSTSPRGAGGTSTELPCCFWSRPVTIADSRAPRASRRPSGSPMLDAGHPGVVEAGLAGGEQPAPQVPRPVGPRVDELEAEVGDEVAGHREQRRPPPRRRARRG